MVSHIMYHIFSSIVVALRKFIATVDNPIQTRLDMTATSSSQSPPPADTVQSPLPEYLQRFEQQLPPKREYKTPKLHWKIEDLETKGAERVFLHCTNPVKLLKECIIAIFDLLYTAETCPTQYVRRLSTSASSGNRGNLLASFDHTGLTYSCALVYVR